ncbi:MAG: GntR family transcriptional regulator [Oscillospiraceae bacterium]|nr:GntR family transcriptional regulator [Oscillospiraceae bacterium]
MGWELRTDRQIWQQLAELLMLKIVSGEYPAGGRIPSVRDLASEAGVNPNTMQRALASLEESELVTATRNTGRFVTQDDAQICRTRAKLAQTELGLFFERMMRLGYKKEDVASMLTSKEKGEEFA